MIRTGRTTDCAKHGTQAAFVLAGDEICIKCRRDEFVREHRCACGCGEPLWGRAANVRFVLEKHKYRARRQDLKALAEALGVPASVSAGSLRLTTATGNRGRYGDKAARSAQTPPRAPRKPALRLSYRKTLAALTEAVYELMPGAPREFAAERAVHILSPLLTDRQRAAL